METAEITYHRRYIDDIINIFDQNKITEISVTSYTNNIHKHLEFKLTEEKNKNRLSITIQTQRQKQHPTRDLQKTHTDRRYYTLYIQTSIRTQTRSLQLLHKQNVFYTNHRTNKTARM